MRRTHWILSFTFVATTAVAIHAQQPAAGGPAPKPMTLTTTAFPDGSQIPAKYTQAGDQISPALSWSRRRSSRITSPSSTR